MNSATNTAKSSKAPRNIHGRTEAQQARHERAQEHAYRLELAKRSGCATTDSEFAVAVLAVANRPGTAWRAGKSSC